MLGHFRRHLDQRYRVLDLTPAIFADAMLRACGRRLRAYDAVQLAAALELRRQHQDAGLSPITLISADRDLNAAATAEGLIVRRSEFPSIAAVVFQTSVRFTNAPSCATALADPSSRMARRLGRSPALVRRMSRRVIVRGWRSPGS